MKEKSAYKAAQAPYNFVPFSDKVLTYGESLPPHDHIDPQLKTGEIHITLTARTPIFISAGDKSKSHFFRSPNGRLAIPGSSLRGLVRENMQILGFALIRPGEDLDDRRIFYRRIADARGSGGEALKKYYHAALDVHTQPMAPGIVFSKPENVRSGYLCCQGNSFYIKPTTGPYLRVPPSQTEQFGSAPARAISVVYRESGGKLELYSAGDAPPELSVKKGMLIFTGPPLGKRDQPVKQNSRYLFPAADESAAHISISEADRVSYEADWEGRRNTLRPNADFWALPSAGEKKPVFYVQHDGHVFFGMSLFLRIGFRNPLSQGLPPQHKKILRQKQRPLDYPRAILGYAENKNSYRSRVSFGDGYAQERAAEMPPVTIVPGEPKLSFFLAYVEGGQHYNEENFRLRGYKQYWLKDEAPQASGKPKVDVDMQPLPAGTEFKAIIRYRNLYPHELGLLLWALRLQPDCYQSLGMGKAYGFGRLELHIDSLRELDARALYRSLEANNAYTDAAAETERKVQDYINCYERYAAQRLQCPSLFSCGEIQDFFFLRSHVLNSEEAKNFAYMKLPEFSAPTTTAMPTIAYYRQDQEISASTPETMEDKRAALLAKYGSKHKR